MRDYARGQGVPRTGPYEDTERSKGMPLASNMPRAMLLLLLFVVAAWMSATPFYDSPSPIVRGPILLGDPAGTLGADEALSRLASLGNAELPVAISTRNYWWLAEVENPSASTEWIVHVANTAIERAEFYIYADQEPIHHEAVDLLAMARSGHADYIIGHHFSLPIPSGSRRTVLLRLETAVTHRGLIFIKPAAVASAEARFYMVAIWSGIGAMTALICYNLFLGLSLRLASYLYYVVHASGHLLYLLTALGMCGAGLPILERYLLLNIPGIGLGVLGGALFVYFFLDLPTLAPRLARVYRYFIGSMLVSPLLLLVLEPHTFLTLIRASHLLLAPLVFAAALTGSARQKPEARYILVGWGGMLVMTSKGMLGVLGIVELTIDAGIWGLWAILFEMFFLSLALADRVRRLHREKQAAQLASAAKSTFLANMSHEIRTPLNGVLGMVDVLRGTPLDSQQRQYLEHIGQSGTALLSLLDDILDYSRVEAGRIQLEQTDFAPQRLLEELVFLLSTQAEKKGVQLQLTIAPDLPPVLRGDPGRLRQILLNLLGNAIKFTEHGQVQLAAECLAHDGTDNTLRFTVTDTGIGMDADTVAHLFSRFQQADSSIARRYGGSGLGLAIVNELVQLMGGTIEVSSRPGQGSCFQVVLPLATGVQAPAPVTTASDISLSPLRILVVDDDAINRLVATSLLARDGHQVEAVDNANSALKRLRAEQFDLVLMDLGMPDMDGLEATRRLRATGATVPVIGLTAHVMPDQQAACLEAGMNAVIHKPIQADMLKRQLADVLQAMAPDSGAAPAAT